jgi:RNA polymerase sigma-70 factor (ECF subfamily)
VSSGAPERLLWFPAMAGRRVSAASEGQVSAGQAAPSDEELLGRVQKKDYDAVAILFDRYSRLFIGIAYRILRDRGEAEDMVQEIFLRLCQKSNTFDPAKGSARTWMVQFAYRRSFDRRSYLSRRFFYAGTEIEQLKNTLQEATGLEDQISARLTAEQLHAGFEELNDKQSATLQLFFFEGYDLREAAQCMGESLENTRHYYYRGLERLRRTAIAWAMRSEKSKP